MARPSEPPGSEPPGERLPATAWAVLGVLSFGEGLTGYEIREEGASGADHIRAIGRAFGGRRR